MKWSIVRRRLIWWPTWRGWLVLLILVSLPTIWWCFEGQEFLSQTKAVDASVLVVEAWIGIMAIQSAAAEFQHGDYELIVATGDVSDSHWDTQQWQYPEMAKRVLLEAGVPEDKIILAYSGEVKKHRTFASAAAAWRALHGRGIEPDAINVFTKGSHARRSQLVFTKAFGPATAVGGIAWSKPSDRGVAWWDSSSAARATIIETIGYFYELLLNSGRTSNSVELEPATSEGL